LITNLYMAAQFLSLAASVTFHRGDAKARSAAAAVSAAPQALSCTKEYRHWAGETRQAKANGFGKMSPVDNKNAMRQ